MEPPYDPEGNMTMHPDLIMKAVRIVEILENALQTCFTWLMSDEQLYEQKVIAEGKDLQDRSVEELDENLRKQWPRKGRLEVEIFQQRKSEITAHNKKYERHVRTQLEKYQLLDESWALLIETMTSEF
jgi:hypothetical protein